MITGIAHNAVTVRDMKESLCFYTEALGFKKAFEIANPETGAVNQTIAENLEFWGPILEFLIGAPYLLALVFAFVVCLAAQDISLLVLVIFLVPTLSLAISIVAPYFTMAFVMDTITLGMGTEIAMEGAAASSVAMAMAGPTASAAVGCYYAFLQVAFAAVAVLFESLFFFSRMK